MSLNVNSIRFSNRVRIEQTGLERNRQIIAFDDHIYVKWLLKSKTGSQSIDLKPSIPESFCSTSTSTIIKFNSLHILRTVITNNINHHPRIRILSEWRI